MQLARAAIRITCQLCTDQETYQLGFTSAVPAALTKESLDAKTMPICVLGVPWLLGAQNSLSSYSFSSGSR